MPRTAPKRMAADTRMCGPDHTTVARRLAGLSLTSVPWFRQDVDLTPLDDGSESCGPAVYSAPV